MNFDVDKLTDLELCHAIMREVYGVDAEPPAPVGYRFEPHVLTHPVINFPWAFATMQTMRQRYAGDARRGLVPEFNSGWSSASGGPGKSEFHGNIYLRGEPYIDLRWADDVHVLHLREALYLARRLRAAGVTVQRFATFHVPVAKRNDRLQSDGMCGRFYLSSHTVSRLNRDAPDLFADLNDRVKEQVCSGDVRPTNQVLTITSEPKMQLARWGWDRDFNHSIINARTDKLKGRFWNKAVRERRCILLATGFYEWVADPDTPKKKEVKAIQTFEAGPMLMAGIWELNKEHGPCVSIITTEAPKTMFGTHDRCPAIFNKEQMETWLDPDTDPDKALELCTPYAGDMVIWTTGKPEKGVIPRPPRPGDKTREQRNMF